MSEKNRLQEEIEQARLALDEALQNGIDAKVYVLSVELDKLIEAYIEECEQDKINLSRH